MKTQNTNEPQPLKDLKYYQNLIKQYRKEFEEINSQN